MHLAFLTLLIRGMQMFHWWDNSLFWSQMYISIWTFRYQFFKKLRYFFPQVNARVFPKCTVHLGSLVLVPHAATTSLIIRYWLIEMVNEECGISRFCRRNQAVSCRWETQRTNITKLSLLKKFFPIVPKNVPCPTYLYIHIKYPHFCTVICVILSFPHKNTNCCIVQTPKLWRKVQIPIKKETKHSLSLTTPSQW
jgi:hypothetical protein